VAPESAFDEIERGTLLEIVHVILVNLNWFRFEISETSERTEYTVNRKDQIGKFFQWRT